MQKINKIILWILPLFLIITAFLLRYHQCFTRPYWGDEAFTASSVDSLLSSVQEGRIPKGLSYAPLYKLLCLGFKFFVPDVATAIRMPSFLAGIAVVPVFFVMTRNRFGYITALVSAAVITFYPAHVGISQFARGYSLAFLLGGISLLYSFSAFQKRSVSHLFCAGIFAVLSAASHPTGIFVLCSELCFGVYRIFLSKEIGSNNGARRDLFGKYLTGVYCVAILAGLGFAVVILSRWRLNAAIQFDYSPLSFLIGWGIDYGIPLCMFGMASFCFFVFTNDREGVFASIITVTPLIMLVGFGAIHITISPYYAYASGIGLPLMVGVFCQRISEMYRWKNEESQLRDDRRNAVLCYAVIGALIFAGTLGPAITLASYYINGSIDFEEVTRWVEKNSQGKPIVISTAPKAYPAYFAKKQGINIDEYDSSVTLDVIKKSLKNGHSVVVSDIWLGTLDAGDLENCDFPIYYIVSTERDGITPVHRDDYIDVLHERGWVAARSGSFQEKLDKDFLLVKRFGKTRLDHRQSYLQVYQNKRSLKNE